MGKIAVIGSTNIDLITYGTRLPLQGETFEAEHFKITNGGKGANQAIAARKLGSDVLMVSKVGNDIFADNCLRNYKKYGVDTSYVNQVTDVPTGVAPIFVNTQTSQNSILIIKGANNYLLPEDIIDAQDALKTVDIIVLQLEIPLETVYYAIDFAQQNNIKIILNPAPALESLSLDYICKVDYLIPNETELSILTGMPVDSTDDINFAANKLFDKGLNNLIVTLGSKGNLWLSKNNNIFTQANKVNAIDTSGAGDAFIGSFAHYLSETNDTLLSITKASLYASISVTKEGTQSSYPHKYEFEII